jgi:enediyne biosynthesis protein E4
MSFSRRSFLRSLAGGSLILPSIQQLRGSSETLFSPDPAQFELGFDFMDVARSVGLNFRNYYGGEKSKRYILEANGCGVAFFDYDNDGWLDILLLNGSRVEGFPAGQQPTNRLLHNNRDGSFTDRTEKAGLIRHGWSQGVCIGDYDNDGYEDLFLTYWGQNVLYHNNGDGTFTDVTAKAGLAGKAPRWGTGCTFLDYDRDGHLDLFVSNYLDFDFKTAMDPGTNPYCFFRGLAVNCGPRGLKPESNLLYHNNGDGTFTDVSESSGITKAGPYYGLTAVAADFDNDGWPDIYVANDVTPSLLYQNNHDGTFTEVGLLAGCAYDVNGKAMSGMGVGIGDYDCDGWFDIFRTNFSEEPPTLYHNNGKAIFSEVTQKAGVARYDRLVGWGCGFADFDNDGWLDLFYCNGATYPELDRAQFEDKYLEPSVLYRNLRDGRFEDVSARAGACVTARSRGMGCAFGDFDNDGNVDILINRMNDYPSLLRCRRKNNNHWISIRAIGTKSNRSAIGARFKCFTGNHVQMDEVRSGGSFISQNDLRIHFGLGTAEKIDRIEVQWPSGHSDVLRHLSVNQSIRLWEGGKYSRVK